MSEWDSVPPAVHAGKPERGLHLGKKNVRNRTVAMDMVVERLICRVSAADRAMVDNRRPFCR